MRPSAFTSLVDSFFELKKLQVKQRLRDSMETIVDELFGELVSQVKEMLAKDEPATVESASSQMLDTKYAKETFPTAVKSPKTKQPQVFANKPTFVTSKSTTTKRYLETTTPTTIESLSIKKLKTESFDDQEDTEEPDFATNQDDEQEFAVQPDAPTSFQAISPENTTQTVGKYTCPVANCGKTFKRSDLLVKHTRVHSGAKPYTCSYPGCSYASTQRANTIAHIRRQHLKQSDAGEDGEPPTDPKMYLLVEETLL